MSQTNVKALFPTPFMKVSGLLPLDFVAACIDHVRSSDTRANARSSVLRHTDIVDPEAEAPFDRFTEQSIENRRVESSATARRASFLAQRAGQR
jgi:hypothetical protein